MSDRAGAHGHEQCLEDAMFVESESFRGRFAVSMRGIGGGGVEGMHVIGDIGGIERAKRRSGTGVAGIRGHHTVLSSGGRVLSAASDVRTPPGRVPKL